VKEAGVKLRLGVLLTTSTLMADRPRIAIAASGRIAGACLVPFLESPPTPVVG
jgi:hypothetical protein